MKQIPLTGGGAAIVDDEWYPILSRWSWYLSTKGYAVRDIGGRGSRQHVSMHRYIVMAPDGWEVDHKDRCRLNNQWENLRIATPGNNQHNKGMQRNNATGYKGVSFDKTRGKFVASISFQHKQKNIGRFDTAIEAARAYNHAASELHGDFAWLNEISSE